MSKRGAVLAAVCLVSCGADTGFATLDNSASKRESAERWSSVDAPELLGEEIQTGLASLPLEGSVNVNPWVGSYWPVYLDSINYRWAGPYSESAPAKYERAFGGESVEDAVSRYHGLDIAAGRTCYNHNQCGFGSMCGFRAGRGYGTCVPLWWGICQAWATASILHAEPRHPVTYNGVEFNVMDLKALLSLSYYTADTKQISLRCELPSGSIPYDAVGRPTDASCRDSNPGTYHLLLANRIGIQGKAFIEDRTIDQDVWNQPVRAYRVVRMQEVSIDTANSILGIGNRNYPYNPQAQRFVYTMTDVWFIRESAAEEDGYLGDHVDNYTFTDRYEYILELDRRGDIIGGEWVGKSKHDHPDFLWVAFGANSAASAGGAIEYDNVMHLVNQAY